MLSGFSRRPVSRWRKEGHDMSRERTATSVTTRTLTPLEEQVVRMRRGYRAPHDVELERKAPMGTEAYAQIEAIERRALAMAGARKSDTKRRIVDSLTRKH